MAVKIERALLLKIMLFFLISNLRAFRLQGLVKSGALSRSYGRSFLATSRRKKENDFIEAEIVGEEAPKDQSGGRITRRQDNFSPQKESSGIFNRLAKFFGQDEESKRKKEQKKAMNTAIDKVLEVIKADRFVHFSSCPDSHFCFFYQQGTGPIGALVGGLAKGIGGMLTESIIAASRDSEVSVTVSAD
jgi:hypothetical protein